MKLPPKIRLFLVDTLVMTFLTSAPAAGVEFYVLGLPAEDVIGIRSLAAAVSLATGGLYGRWRDFCVSRLGGSLKDRLLADMLANVAFTLVLYPVQLRLFQANGTQIFRGLAIALLGCVVVGPVTGIFLEAARAGFRPRAVLQALRSPPRHARAKNAA